MNFSVPLIEKKNVSLLRLAFPFSTDQIRDGVDRNFVSDEKFAQVG